MKKVIKPDAELTRLARTLVPAFVRNLIDAGVIDPKGKTGLQLVEETQHFFARHRNAELTFTIDHTDKLLRQARLFRKENERQIACLFYALYIEHKLNSYMALLASRKKLSAKDTESLIRDSSYRAKCSWLLHIFGIRALDNTHINTITKLMELRNSYVHYKWKPENEQLKKELEAMLGQIEKTVKYIRYFEAKYLALTSQRRVSRLLKKRA